jgi:mono/diheme cytochrome c family protein
LSFVRCHRSIPILACIAATLLSFILTFAMRGESQATVGDTVDDYAKAVRPVLEKYCLQCHSTKAKKGSLDLERFASLQEVRKNLKVWQHVVEQVEAGEMPPKSKPQPTDTERKRLLAWIGGFLDAEARARSGDPGHVPLRRLSNAEYDCTIRDLTGVDLKPTREFPSDGAAGEGFTNAAEALSDISPTLFSRYLNAAKEIADHAVLLPNGFRFSPAKTRRDWTNESTARLRAFYANYTSDGRLSFQPYLLATVRHRRALMDGAITTDKLAAKEKLNPKYLAILWQTLTGSAPSQPLDDIRARWRNATEKDVTALAADITAWQTALWKFVPVGSYRYGNTTRQVASDPAAGNTVALRLPVKPAPGQREVTVYLMSRDTGSDGDGAQVVWHRPRFEGTAKTPGKTPLLLKDYPQFGPAYELDYTTAFADTAKYLDGVAALSHEPKPSPEDLAAKHGLDVALLKRWRDVVALERPKPDAEDAGHLGRIVPAAALERLDEPTPKNNERPAIKGWRRKGVDLPVLVTNASNDVAMIPGTVPPHKVAVHPTPTEFVAVTWQSPVSGTFRVRGEVTHAHPACGNGVAWWLEHRRATRAAVLGEGTLDLGRSVKLPERTFKLDKGDLLILAVDARNGDHTCDMTQVGLTITETDNARRVWDLAADIADSVLAGNPHGDKHGNQAVWSFVRGPTRPVAPMASAGSVIPGSILGRWREVAADHRRRAEAEKLATQVQAVLTGPRPGKDRTPDQALYDALVSPESALLKGLDLTRLVKRPPSATSYGIATERFGRHPDGKPTEQASLVVRANTVTEVRLPAALFRDREFVVEGKLDGPAGERVVQFQVLTSPPGSSLRWDGTSAVIASAAAAGFKKLLDGHVAFRRCFSWYLCFPNVVPTDEVVCLKMFHREDEPLERLFLDAAQKRRIDQLWSEHRFISQQPVVENDYLPQFIGYVTQDQPKELLAYFESQRPVFKKRADEFAKDYQAAIPTQLNALTDFAARAFRRPLEPKEKTDLLTLYDAVRKKGASHEEAFRGVLSRVLVSPSFLFRIENAPPGVQPGPVTDWELATRLSYFLWSSTPDDELRRVAAEGKLRDPQALAQQARRMLKDERLRSLAIEFGTQWIHVRGFDELKEKNEKLFPSFDANLRMAIYEESILFFQDLFQSDRDITQILDADYTFLNETLAKHYGIPGVTGPHWRRVNGVRKFGRGGILTLASVQAKQSGASRTSPVLRGNWVVETLLGEKLPRPPANVPILPDEPGNDKLTTRQQVERHINDASCAVCHMRIDPFGFAFEKYDAIGRLRDKDAGGQPLDTRARLKDGTEFDGIDGLRTYLLTKKKDVIIRLFCRRLVGYALGRASTLSDTSLINDMVSELHRNDGRLSAAVLTIVRSPQFRMIRGSECEQ